MKAAAVAASFLVASACWAQSIPQQWYQVQQALERGDVAAVSEEVAVLRARADDLGIKRMPSYSLALALAARSQGFEHPELLDQAELLDSTLPDLHFIKAQMLSEKRSKKAAFKEYWAGWRSLFKVPDARASLISGLIPWLLLGLGAAAAVYLLVRAGAYIPELIHDAYELASIRFADVNAAVGAAALLMLPILAGLGPAWLAVYIAALAWSYYSLKEKLLAAGGWLVLVLLVPALVGWHSSFVAWPDVLTRTARSVTDRVVEAALLDELLALDSELGRDARYDLLVGELAHMLGERRMARQRFREASRSDPAWALPDLWLGIMALEDGEYRLAVRLLQSAISKDGSLVEAYSNLSTALSHVHLFEEAEDVARQERALMGGRKHKPVFREVEGLRIAYPTDAKAVAADLLASLPKQKKVALGLIRPHGSVLSDAIDPYVLCLLVGGVLAVVVWQVRIKWFPTGRSCSKCGRVFCERCKPGGESSSYCSQCETVFLKSEEASIDQRTSKLDQIRRRARTLTVVRLVLNVLAPGAGLVAAGRAATGAALLVVASCGVLGRFLWLPRFVAPLAYSLDYSVLSWVMVGVWVISLVAAVRLCPSAEV